MTSLGRLASAAAAIGLVAFAAPARAEIACTVLEIEAATAATPSIDPKLRPLERKLKKPPFTSWNSFQQLGTTQLGLDLQKSASAALVHGKINLHVRDVIERPGKRARLQLGIALDDGAGKRVIDTKVNVDVGDYFVAGRPLPGDKGHLVAVTCTKP